MTGHPVRILVVAVLAVALAGCLKFDMDLAVSSDDTVDGTMILAVDRSLVELGGGQLDDLVADAGPLPEGLEGVTVEPFEDDDHVGQEYRLDDVPLEALAEGGDPDALRIVRDGDVFRVSGAMDLTQGMTPGTDDLGDLGLDPSVLLSDLDLRIRLTFPGEVLESNGTVDGTSVTWEPVVGQANELTAVARADAGLVGLAWWVGLALLVALGLVVLAIVWLARRSRPVTATADGPVAATPASAPPPPPPPPPAPRQRPPPPPPPPA